MGTAAENRYKAMVRREADDREADRHLREGMQRAAEVAVECDEFVRLAMTYIAEPTGMRKPTVERMKQKRGFPKRNDALVQAHNAWVNANPQCVMSYHAASVRRAKAAHALLDYLLADWHIPNHIKVPRAAT